MAKLKDYKTLVKFNLSLLVLMSSITAFVIAPGSVLNLASILSLALGGFLITAAANAANQWLERDTDPLMKRTKERPIVQGRISKEEVFVVIGGSLICGALILALQFNWLTAVLSVLSFALYVFVYTPMKRESAFSVLVGAIPGALPCLIGWAAATGSIMSTAAWVLFLFQFFWQFPHFWSIAWINHDDYQKAGMKMLPQKTKEGRFTAFQSVFYAALLIPISGLPYALGMASAWASIILLIAALVFVGFALKFYKDNSDKAAKSLMFASFAYLPIILLTLIANSIF